MHRIKTRTLFTITDRLRYKTAGECLLLRVLLGKLLWKRKHLPQISQISIHKSAYRMHKT